MGPDVDFAHWDVSRSIVASMSPIHPGLAEGRVGANASRVAAIAGAKLLDGAVAGGRHVEITVGGFGDLRQGVLAVSTIPPQAVSILWSNGPEASLLSNWRTGTAWAGATIAWGSNH